MPKERTFEEAVAWARRQDLNDRRIIRRVEGFITQGWASPDPKVQRTLTETATAVVAEAREAPRTRRPRTGRANFA